MTGSKLQSLLKGIGISSYNDVQLKNLNTIIMSQNFYVVPDRDFFTFDFTNEIIKIKQRQKIVKDGKIEYKDISTHTFDIYLDMANVIGFEFLHPRSRY